MPEDTPTGILYKLNMTGKLPEQLMPVAEFQTTPEDPTKPLRVALEGVVLARASVQALKAFDKVWQSHKHDPSFRAETIPIKEIDKEPFVDRHEILFEKYSHIDVYFSQALEKAVTDELKDRALPPKINYAYDVLVGESTVDETVEGIMSAQETLPNERDQLIKIGFEEYPDVLKYNPTTRQIIDLVANSYQSYIHPMTGIHPNVTTIGHRIDLSSLPHKVILINPSQYHQQIKAMRKSGEIKDQPTHCPFAMSAQFTNPFLNSGEAVTGNNPLQVVYETLLWKYLAD